MVIYFVRHGETDANIQIANGESPGDTDPPLNQTGQQQAQKVAEELKAMQFDAFLSSTMIRARQTAEAINVFHHLPIIETDELRERSTGTALISPDRWHELFDIDANLPVPGAETAREFFGRLYRYIDELRRAYSGKTILIVSHGGVGHAFYAYAHHLPLAGNMRIIRMHNCEVRIYHYDDIPPA